MHFPFTYHKVYPMFREIQGLECLLFDVLIWDKKMGHSSDFFEPVSSMKTTDVKQVQARS